MTTTLPHLSPAAARFLELVAESPKDGPSVEAWEAARHLLGASRPSLDSITSTSDGVVIRMAKPPAPPDWSHQSKGEPPGIAVEYIVAPADRPDADGEVGLQLITPLPHSSMHIYRHRNPALASFYIDAEPIIARVAQAAKELQLLTDRAVAGGAFGPSGPPAVVATLEEIAEWSGGTFARLVEVARSEKKK